MEENKKLKELDESLKVMEKVIEKIKEENELIKINIKKKELLLQKMELEKTLKN